MPKVPGQQPAQVVDRLGELVAEDRRAQDRRDAAIITSTAGSVTATQMRKTCAA